MMDNKPVRIEAEALRTSGQAAWPYSPEQRVLLAGLMAVASAFGEIRGALTAARKSFALTINSLYEGSRLSERYSGDAKRLIDRNLEFRLEISLAVEKLAMESLALDTEAAACQGTLERLLGNADAGDEEMPYPDWKSLLREMETRLHRLHPTFLLFLSKSLFLNLALEFSNQLLGLDEHSPVGRSPNAMPTLSDSIDQVVQHSSNAALGRLKGYLVEFENAQSLAWVSLKNGSGHAFHQAMSECERIASLFLSQTNVCPASAVGTA